MSTKFNVIARKDMSQDAAEDDVLYYASAKVSGEMNFESLCRNISLISTASQGDVEVVIRGLVTVASEALQRGECVDLGALGRLRISLSSKGAATAKEFNTSNIRKANVIFTPGTDLKDTAKKMKFERIGVQEGSETSQTEPEEGAGA